MTGRTPLDDVEFLVRSGHRVEVLEVLIEAGHTRRAIHERTGISQPTLGRILGAFQDRGWVEKHGSEFSLTAFGRLIAEEFDDTLEAIETINRFREVAPHLPLDELVFDFGELSDATITMPSEDDNFAHLSRAQRLLADSDTFRILAPSIYQPALRDLYERLQVGDVVSEAIFSNSAIDTLHGDPKLTAVAREMLETERTSLYGYDGAIPYILGIADGRAFLLPLDERRTPVATIETANEAVLSWAEGILDEYRDRSERLTAEHFSG